MDFPTIIGSDINWGLRAHDMGKLPIIDLAQKIGERGFAHIQLALQKALTGIDASYGSLSPGMGRLIRQELAKQEIHVSVLGCYINPVHPEEEVRKDHLNRFIEHLTYARDFGCSLVGTETGALSRQGGPTSQRYRDETFQDFIASLAILVEAAEKTGTIVAIEGVADKDTIYSHSRMQKTLELIPSPNLAVIYDPVNFLPLEKADQSDRLMEEAFDMFAHKMVAIHGKDYLLEKGRINKSIPSGKGMLNYPLLLDLIRRYKPMIPVLLENNTPRSIDDTITFINQLNR